MNIPDSRVGFYWELWAQDSMIRATLNSYVTALKRQLFHEDVVFLGNASFHLAK